MPQGMTEGSADVVVSCVPITHETEGMIGSEQFSKMKKGAYLINVSRGKVVDPEPLPAESPLWKMENVIITPHVAGVSDARGDCQNSLIASNLERFVKGMELETASLRKRDTKKF